MCGSVVFTPALITIPPCDSFNAGIQNLLSPEDAARATFTGKMAAKYGFTEVTIEETVGSPGEYTAAKVVFSK
jgi:hypothetical protein